jgi:hypothetical protein
LAIFETIGKELIYQINRDEDLKERRKKAIWSNVIHVRM